MPTAGSRLLEFAQESGQYPLLELEMIPAKSVNENYLELERTSFLPYLESLLIWLVGENAFQSVPVLSSLIMPGTYFFIFIFTCSCCLYNKTRKSTLVLALIAGLIVTLFLSPVCIYRYCLSLVAVSPLLIAILLEPQHSATRKRSPIT